MATFIANGSPCTNDPCCPYCIARSGTQYSEVEYTALDQTFSGLCFPSSATIAVYWDFFGFIKNRLIVYANGVSVFDTGCVDTSGSTTVTIPSGTTSIRYYIRGVCAAPTGTDQWSLTVTEWP